MKNRSGIFLSRAVRMLLCACVLMALPAGARERAAGDEAATTTQALIAKRGKLRNEELKKREQAEADKWAQAKQKGVAYVKTIKRSGEIDKRVDVVIFAEGFQRNELGNFDRDAARGAIQLLKSYPYSDYAAFFNFHVVGVASRESGVSTAKKRLNTAFGAMLHEDNNMLTAELSNLQPYLDIPPDMDLGIILVNTTMAQARSSACGPFVTLRLGGDLGRTVAHEFGHAFGHLADEYEEKPGSPASIQEPGEVNVTVESDPRKVKWHYWIGTVKGVGVYEGANLYSKGHYRPEPECLMRSGDRFCHVCLEEMIRRMYESVPPIDAAYPLGHEITLMEGGKQEFAVRANSASSGPVGVEWFVDGVSRQRGKDTFTFSGLEFKAGEHEVMARAIAVNPNVLRDKGLLESSMFWKVKVTPGSAPAFEPLHAPLRVNAGEGLKYTAKASAEKALTYRIDRGPEGLQINAETGEMTWTPRKEQAGAHLAVVTADDGEHKASLDVVIGVVDRDAQRNNMPVMDYIPIQDVKKGELIEFQVTAVDLDGNSVVFDLPDAPPGATFDRETGKFRWRPEFSQAGQYELGFEAWDGSLTDKYKVPVIVEDELFSAADIASAERDMAGGKRDAFVRVFYALRSKNASIRRQGINMLKNEGAKSSALELNRMLRDGDASVADTAADALLALVKEKLAPEDDAYFTILVNDIARTAGQMQDEKARLVKLKEIVEAVGEKTTDKKIKKAAEDVAAWLDKMAR